MEISEVREHHPECVFELECLDDYSMKRELTVGKKYFGRYWMDNEQFSITNDYGGHTFAAPWRFKLVEAHKPDFFNKQK